MDISATAAPQSIKLNTYPGIYMVPSHDYVDSMKAATTPRTMFPVLEREYDWRPHIGVLPNVKSRETVLALAQMANNAYSADEQKKDWRDVDGSWRSVRQLQHERQHMV
jgi:putative lipase involved disintegration of autophagic bodies